MMTSYDHWITKPLTFERLSHGIALFYQLLMLTYSSADFKEVVDMSELH
jgi:hypothetical protein